MSEETIIRGIRWKIIGKAPRGPMVGNGVMGYVRGPATYSAWLEIDPKDHSKIFAVLKFPLNTRYSTREAQREWLACAMDNFPARELPSCCANFPQVFTRASWGEYSGSKKEKEKIVKFIQERNQILKKNNKYKGDKRFEKIRDELSKGLAPGIPNRTYEVKTIKRLCYTKNITKTSAGVLGE